MYGEYGKVAAALAQSVERKPFKLVAVGSSPTVGNQNFFISLHIMPLWPNGQGARLLIGRLWVRPPPRVMAM